MMRRRYSLIIFSLILIILGFLSYSATTVTQKDAQKFLNYFYNDKVPECITDRYLLTAGKGIVPYLIMEIRKKDMQKRRYAIAVLGKLGDSRALPLLVKIHEDLSEEIYFRCDALVSIWYIDRKLGEELAEKFADVDDSCVELLRKGVDDPDYERTFSGYLLDRVLYLLDKYDILHQ